MKRSLIKIILFPLLCMMVMAPVCDIGETRVIITQTFTVYGTHKWFDDEINDFHFILLGVQQTDIDIDHSSLIVRDESLTTGQILAQGTNLQVRPYTFSLLNIHLTGSECECTIEPSVAGEAYVYAVISYNYSPSAAPFGCAWTYSSSPSRTVAVSTLPWQRWDAIGDTILAVVFNPVLPDTGFPNMEDVKHKAGGPIKIGRSWAVSKNVIELEDMAWDSEQVVNLKWQDVEIAEILEGDSTVFRITGFKPKKHKSVLVKYWVYIPSIEDTAFYFVNQAEITTKKPEPEE